MPFANQYTCICSFNFLIYQASCGYRIAMRDAEIKNASFFVNEREKYFKNLNLQVLKMPTNSRPAFNVG